MCLGVWFTEVAILRTHRLILAKDIVHSQPRGETALMRLVVHSVDNLSQEFAVRIGLDILVGTRSLVLRLACDGGGNVQSAMTIVDIQLFPGSPPHEVRASHLFPKSPALALRTLGLDTNHRLGACGIASARVADDFHVHDLFGRDAVEFLQVIDLTVVDIHLGGSPAIHLDGIVSLLDARQSAE